MTTVTECGTISLELVVKFINVNYEKGAELLTKCRTMQGYGILADFLKEHGGDVMSFLFEKMTREECEAVREADGFAAGYEQAEAEVKRTIAANCKKAGIDIDVIAESTGLTKEEIENL